MEQTGRTTGQYEDVLLDIMNNDTFDEDELERYVNQLIEEIKAEGNEECKD